ncbi:hypothetical protein JRQ81_016501 [Phrynocephalus forsythii]|uniref:ceramidase n=1 Tax=Phrynocephalus forsythii TaxID=171643 RepID=A0A9Q0XTD3_9SAUR|nr:hypothetical protein JRQ81_016501 [Phrynocephalus forsythii]
MARSRMRAPWLVAAATALVAALAVLAKDPFAEDCRRQEYPPSGPRFKGKTPTYIINLDLPPSERWVQLAREKRGELITVIQTLKNLVASFASAQKIIASLESKFAWIGSTLPYPFNEEIKGIASAIDASLGDVVVFNIFYEIFTVCTSIVAEDSSGKLYHARNLDFGLFLGWDIKNSSWTITEVLRPLMVSLDFQRNNKTVFKSSNLAGYVGMISGVKPNISLPTMFNILSTKPVLNKLTVSTTLLEVSEGHIETYLRDCPTPCSPW